MIDMDRSTTISCSAEHKIFKIPREGEAVIAGYWSPELGLCSQSVLLRWKNGKVDSLQSSVQLENSPHKTQHWESYFLLPGWIDAHVHLALDSLDFYQCLKDWTQPSLTEENIQGFLRHYLERGIVAIRDGGDLPGFSWKAKNKVNEGAWLGPKAISYTHLRAHETRHDLVCRLLL